MIRLLTVIGARPQIIKAAAFSRAIQKWNNTHIDKPVKEVILHTGQHYDDNMSAVFFRELSIPEPDINLHVGSGSHGTQTARMIEGIEQVLQNALQRDEPFDGVVLYGDTNSTLAGAVAASKIHVPVFHIEAGLRSYNMSMPEEINRIVCDQLSTILFSPTQTGVDNLQREGLTNSPARFADGNRRKVVLSGDVMFDNSMYFLSMAEQQSEVLQKYSLAPKHFVLATIHRPANTDNPERLTSIFSALLRIADKGQTIVLPLHPRTRKLLSVNLLPEIYQRLRSCEHMLITEPAGFFDIIRLERHASLVLTDSGGVQKEAFFFETPSVILRTETEWVEIVNAGAGILADADEEMIVKAADELMGKAVHFPKLFGDAHAAEHILACIIDSFGQ